MDDLRREVLELNDSPAVRAGRLPRVGLGDIADLPGREVPRLRVGGEALEVSHVLAEPRPTRLFLVTPQAEPVGAHCKRS